MSYHQDRFALISHEMFKDFKDMISRDGIKAACGFICHQDGRIICKRARNRNTLLLSTGNLRRKFIGMILDFNEPEQLQSAFARGFVGL